MSSHKGRPQSPLPPAADLLAMLASGMSSADIAREYGCSKTTVNVRINDSGLRQKRTQAPRFKAPPYRPPMWMDDAACKSAPNPDDFFPENGPAPDDKLDLCRACPVRLQCLNYALENGIDDGLWGGMYGRARQRLRWQNQRLKTA